MQSMLGRMCALLYCSLCIQSDVEFIVLVHGFITSEYLSSVFIFMMVNIAILVTFLPVRILMCSAVKQIFDDLLLYVHLVLSSAVNCMLLCTKPLTTAQGSFLSFSSSRFAFRLSCNLE